MIQIIANILDMNIASSPLLEGLVDTETIQEDEKATTIDPIKHEISDFIRDVNIDINLCNEVTDDIKGVKVETILRNHLKMINYTIKILNNNEFTFEEFYNYYQGYINNEFVCRNIALKQFLETQFSLLQKSIEEDEFVATKLKDDVDAIINALICAYLTKANPNKYPIFENILNQFNFKGFDAQTVKEIHAYYLRIINKFGI